MPYISNVYARQVLDSRGFPTIQVDEHTASGGAELFLSIIVGASLQKSNEAFAKLLIHVFQQKLWFSYI